MQWPVLLPGGRPGCLEHRWRDDWPGRWRGGGVRGGHRQEREISPPVEQAEVRQATETAPSLGPRLET